MAADDDDDGVVIEMDVTDEIRAVVSEQFRKQLPPDYEFDEASFIEFIMLLVANRRSKAQIRREMAPFVGKAAAALADWLFSAMIALKPPPPPARPRLASVVLAPAAKDDEPAAAAAPRPVHRKTPPSNGRATRLLTNAAKDAAKSASERRSTAGGRPDLPSTSPTSIAVRRARFAQNRPIELRTRRSLGGGDLPKRSRSPRGAVMDQEAKRLKAHVPQNLDRLLDRKLPSARRELQTAKKASARRSPSLSDSERFRADSEEEEARPMRRRALISADKLDQVLSRTLSAGPGRRADGDDDDEPRSLNGTTFTVSITNDEAAENGPAAAAQDRTEPKVIFKVPGMTVSKPDEKAAVGAAVEAALPKKPTRCAFWPKCEKGDACAFAHPTHPCKYWPSCQFGDKCLYIHDKNLANVAIPCKFGAKCTRGADCKYSHRNSALAAAVAGEGQTKVCRYDKRCTKIACPFKHPMREKSEYFNDRLRESHDDDDEDVTVVLSSTLPSTPPRAF